MQERKEAQVYLRILNYLVFNSKKQKRQQLYPKIEKKCQALPRHSVTRT